MRASCSLAAVGNKTIYMIGGVDLRAMEASLASCEKYSIEDNQWLEAPALTKARRQHISCTVGSKIFVLFGKQQTDESSTVEMLETSNQNAQWELIQLSTDLTYRYQGFAGPIDDQSIILLAGTSELQEANVLNFKTGEVGEL